MVYQFRVSFYPMGWTHTWIEQLTMFMILVI